MLEKALSKIVEKMNKRECSLSALAVDIGIPKETLAKINDGRNKNPELKTLNKLLKYYKYTVIPKQKRKVSARSRSKVLPNEQTDVGL